MGKGRASEPILILQFFDDFFAAIFRKLEEKGGECSKAISILQFFDNFLLEEKWMKGKGGGGGCCEPI